MKILITGGAGYIGSVTTELLLSKGHEVTVLDNLSRGHKNSIDQRATFIQGSLFDSDSLLPDTSFDAIIHLAAYISAGESMSRPDLYWDNNFCGTLQLLRAMRKRNIKKIVFASTAAVYGNPVGLPLTEESPLNPINTYGMTKLADEMAISGEVFAHGIDAVSLRFFNVAGAYNGLGESHLDESHIIPILFDVATGKQKKFYMYGNDYPTDDGTCVRDYIHVYDLARAIDLCIQGSTKSQHSIYNLANNRGFSNYEVVRMVEKVTGKKIEIETQDRRSGDPAILIASSDKALHEIGWKPTYPSLEEIVSDAWTHYSARLI